MLKTWRYVTVTIVACTVCVFVLFTFLMDTTTNVGIMVSQEVVNSTSTTPKTVRAAKTTLAPPMSLGITNEMIDTFRVISIRLIDAQNLQPFLLKDYKNPCWVEPVPDGFDYKKTHYGACIYMGGRRKTRIPQGERAFGKMTTLLQERSKKGGEGAWRVRCFPYFFLLGVTKSGTTSIHDTMERYAPEFAPGAYKEYQYWDARRTGTSCKIERAPKFASYLDAFDVAGETIRNRVSSRDGQPYHSFVTGDFSPATLTTAPRWNRKPGNRKQPGPKYMTAHYIQKIFPGVKLMIIMRDPVDRFLSHFRMHERRDEARNKGKTQYNIDYFTAFWQEAVNGFINCETRRSTRQCAYKKLSHSAEMVSMGLYDVFVSDWLAVFPREQFLFIRTEDYQARPLETMQNITQFLGMGNMTSQAVAALEAASKVPHSFSNSSKYMSVSTRERMRKFYRPHNHRLAQLLRDDAYKWGY